MTRQSFELIASAKTLRKEDTHVRPTAHEISASEADALTKHATPSPRVFHGGESITPFSVNEDRARYDPTALANIALAEAAPDLAFTVAKQSSEIEDLELKLNARIEETRAEAIARTGDCRESQEESLGASATQLSKEAEAQLERLDSLLIDIGSSVGGGYAELIDAAADLVGTINRERKTRDE